eukprot:TRINITY_DN4358_c0_g1_i1.p1 TRINITY_DN4358_c0_g1~~TRINITY_DN4358_c0_g1_i1.p1  ORF type:complete len:715 (+),score=197.66 TRINITY_DN4358_c0_g1_i1:242-2146(+)
MQGEEKAQYGLFVNGTWMCESAPLKDYALTNADTISVTKLKKSVAKTLLAATNNDNVKAMISNPLERGGAQPTTAATTGGGGATLKLIPGETQVMPAVKIIHVHTDEGLVRPGLPGWLFVTNFRIAFRPLVVQEVQQLEKAPICMKDGFEAPITSILNMCKCNGLTPLVKFCTITIQTKDFHDMRFCYLIPPKGTEQQYLLPDAILEDGIFNQKNKFFAFNYDFRSVLQSHFINEGWNIYDPVTELQRINVPNKDWRLTQMNQNYGCCASYPSVLSVPASVSEEELKCVFTFRSKGRIPALIWRHHNGAAILRCSQPAVGIAGKRCVEDEEFFRKVGECNNNCKTVYIVDARPWLNARANQLKGLGYEYSKYYPHTVLRFLGIENIHKMREAETKLRAVCLNEPYDAIAKKLSSTKWLLHIGMIIAGAAEIVQLLEYGKSVVIHCSDGWDRTSQLSSLTLIILDPYYRTLNGFMVLIEKEWISYGHMMHKRIAHVPSQKKQGERAPIFPQFIDCVFQLMNHLTNAFEFNEALLVELLRQLYACQYGTFLYDSECDRRRANAQQTTAPLWAHILQNRARFINPNFRAGIHSFSKIKGFELTLWEGYYLHCKQYHGTGDADTFQALWKHNRQWYSV